MGLVLTEDANYHAIADAIRECLRVDDRYLPGEMPDAIRRMATISNPVDVESSLADVNRYTVIARATASDNASAYVYVSASNDMFNVTATRG